MAKLKFGRQRVQFGLLMKRGRAVGFLLLVVASVQSSAQFNALNQIDPVG